MNDLEILVSRLDKTFAAIARSFKTASERGAAAALEELADYMNDCDAVESEDEKNFAAWVAKGRP